MDQSKDISHSLPGDVGMRALVEEFCLAMEYAAGCDEGVDADAAASEIWGWAGSPMAVVYTKARAALTPSAPDGCQHEAWEDRGGAKCCVDCGIWFEDATPSALSGDAGEVETIRQQIINTPETADFMAGVPIEATHQRERWGASHDAGKTPFDWFWLVGYLAQKAASSAVAGDTEKAMHHTISTAAALANWHAALSGVATEMRPGIGPGNGGEKPGSAYALAAALPSHQGAE